MPVLDHSTTLVYAAAVIVSLSSADLRAAVDAEPGSVGPEAANAERLGVLRAADRHGLDPADYGVDELEALAAGTATGDYAARLEGAYRAFVGDLAYGRIRPDVDPGWHIPAPERVEAAAFATGTIESLVPPHAGYRRLHDALLRYRAIRRAGGWPSLPEGPNLSVGMRDGRADFARARLRVTGDFEGDVEADAWFFGTRLDAAVRRFQERHGLGVDGVIGADTRAAMNVSVDERIRQLAIALERWRWLPRDLGREYAWINAARLTLEVVRDGESVLSSRAIVGHSSRPTPSFTSEIRQLVFNPDWTVPETIAKEDLLPRVREDSDYLARNDYCVYSGWGGDAREVDPATVDWASVSADRNPYRFVQRPGPGNSLGLVKMVFDNPYDIYVHDTPAKGLFELRTRTLSSGCVRVERANRLADYLLANYRDPGDTTTADWLTSPETQFVDLQRRMPIYLVYITAWVTEDGEVNFRRDLYGRDRPVAAALRGGD